MNITDYRWWFRTGLILFVVGALMVCGSCGGFSGGGGGGSPRRLSLGSVESSDLAGLRPLRFAARVYERPARSLRRKVNHAKRLRQFPPVRVFPLLPRRRRDVHHAARAARFAP